MSINFSNTHFIKSCLEEKDFPAFYAQRNTLYPEIAIIGRSNAGKSSLINHLTQNKHLVYVSSTPGKTQLINFFNVDDQLLLVDLPGYGFAKVDRKRKQDWGTTLSHYLENRPSLKALILVLDIRRDLSEEDKQMIEWARTLGKPLLFVFSKSDKLSSQEKLRSEKNLRNTIPEELVIKQGSFFPLSYSIKESSCRLLLKNAILFYLNPKEYHGTS